VSPVVPVNVDEDELLDGTANDAALQTQLMVKRFESERLAKRQRRYQSVTGNGVRVVGVGVIVMITGSVYDMFHSAQYMWQFAVGEAFAVIGYGAMACGVVMLSTCPLDEFDMDLFLLERAYYRYVICVPMALLSLVKAATFPHAAALGALLMLGVLCGGKTVHERHRPRSTTLMALWFVVYIFGDGLRNHFNSLKPLGDDVTQYTVDTYQCENDNLTRKAYYEFFTGFVQIYVWLRNKQHGEGARYPTKAFYDALYIFFLIYSGYFAVSAISAIWCPPVLNAVIISSLRFCEAGAFGIPTLVLLYYGRDKMFLTMARIIDQENAENYGAFMSEVLNSSGTVNIGDVWFVHRDEPLEEFEALDPRRNWKRGRVVDIKKDQFVVKLDKHEYQDNTGLFGTNRTKSGGSRGKFKSRSKNKSNGSFWSVPTGSGSASSTTSNGSSKTLVVPFEGGDLEQGVAAGEEEDGFETEIETCHDPGRKTLLARKQKREEGEFVKKLMPGQATRTGKVAQISPVSSDLCFIPMANQSTPSNELLELARNNLRCIEWKNLTLELMTGAILSGKVAAARSMPGAPTPTDDADGPIENLYVLSRAVRPNETIDFFLSHSWHDDAELKYSQLEAVAEEFKSKNLRYPTFWLDKVCIDQQNIADGLKVLPINVMSCRKMLVVCGPTYPTRLWCAWELCTLFSFMREEQALDRCHLVALTSDPSAEEESVNQLTKFDVNHAHCYDPNEEAKLRRVIDAVGEEQFNDRVRALAKKCQSHFVKTVRKSREAKRQAELDKLKMDIYSSIKGLSDETTSELKTKLDQQMSEVIKLKVEVAGLRTALGRAKGD